MEHCFACETDYGYLGTAPHEGSCPACGSTAVTPAGELSVVDTTTWESANGLSTIRVTATDDRSRRFEFAIAARRGQGKLVCLVIDGATVLRRCGQFHLPSLRELPRRVSGSATRRRFGACNERDRSDTRWAASVSSRS